MTDTQNDTGACAAAGGVGEGHKHLEPFAGTFKARVSLWMGPGEPMVSTGVITNTWDLGGRFLKQEYKGDPNPGPFPNFEGRGYWGYNTASKRYEGFWIDNASTIMQTETGSLDASGSDGGHPKVWTMTGELANSSSGKATKKRSVITLQDNDHHSMEIFFTTPGGNESKAMEAQYERVG